MRRLALPCAVVVLLLAPSASAMAGTRYASPLGGTTVGCPQANPCSLAYAITAAAANDEVIVEPGTYPIPATIEASVALAVHGLAGQPMRHEVRPPK